jgi:preprotein translocase subunit SecG
MLQFLIGTLLVLSSLFLIALVLIQQGKGGGLAGAFGGMGGQSAFGTKAGDVFTRVTIITALVWIFFCMLAIKLISKEGPRRSADNLAPPPVSAPLTPGASTPAATTPGDTKPGESKKDDKAVPATTPDPMAPAATTPAAPMESSAPAPASTTPAASTPATETPAPATPATPEKK